jgi:(p)ppGpp synthase/HD superfamily hydrolase
MNDIAKLMRAANFAACKHAQQRRKGENAEPYINHLVEVASLAADATQGDADIVIAALLHDVVEDQGVKFADIADQFGPTVAGFVAEVTDDKRKPKQERKDLQVINAPSKSFGASVIKLADKTSNLRSIAKSPPPWPLQRKQTYLDWARAVIAGLAFKPTGLMADFERAASDLEATLRKEAVGASIP